MPYLHLTTEQQGMLSDFIDQEASGHTLISEPLEGLLQSVMSTVNVRRLESVDPDGVRELLRSTFEAMKVRHLHENGLLSSAQFQVRLDTIQDRVARQN